MTPKDVDAYILNAPVAVQAHLRELRAIIQSAAPLAHERISYGMPYYEYKGRLAYFAHAKHHIGLYLMPPIIEQHKSELSGYVTTTATIHLSQKEALPRDMIKKLIQARVKWNDEKAKK